LLEGGPAVLAGVLNYFIMTDRPEQAKWLTAEERDWLSEELRKDHAARANVEHLGVIAAITNPKVLFLSAIYFIYQVGNLGIGLWMPQIIRGLAGSLTNFEVGLIAMLPYAFRSEERDWLSEELRKDHAARANVEHLGVIAAITNPKVLFLSAIYFIYQVGNLGIGLWMPQIIRGLAGSLTNFEVGLIAMLPYAF